MAIAERFTGTSVRRKEDPRILTGRGNYVADVELPRMLHTTFLRSPSPTPAYAASMRGRCCFD